MQLGVTRRMVSDALGSEIRYEIHCRIRDEGPPYLNLSRHLSDQTLEGLAQRWWFMNRPNEDVDTNATLCGSPDGWADLKLGSFASSGFSFVSGDVVLCLAME